MKHRGRVQPWKQARPLAKLHPSTAPLLPAPLVLPSDLWALLLAFLHPREILRAVLSGGCPRVCHLADQELRWRIIPRTFSMEAVHPVFGCAFSPCGHRLASACAD
eukprot:RCo035424